VLVANMEGIDAKGWLAEVLSELHDFMYDIVTAEPEADADAVE